MLSTDISMSFVRAFELYQIRWNIEVVNRETKQYLRLGTYAGRNLNGQIADATLCYITYTVMALEKRMSDYETMGELFAEMEDDVMSLTLWKRVLACLERLMDVLGEVLGYSILELTQIIANDPERGADFEVMAEALEEKQLRRKVA